MSRPTPPFLRGILALALACTACCALPLLAALSGSTLLGLLALHAESVAWGLLALGGIVWIAARLRRPPSCSVDCGRRPAPTSETRKAPGAS